MIRQAIADEFPVRGRLRRRAAFAAGQQRLFAHNGSRDDRATHEIRRGAAEHAAGGQVDLILDPDGAGRAYLAAGAAADAQLGWAGEVEVGEPAGVGV